jgi:hypothetical protein
MANEPASSKTPVELRAQAHHARELARALLPGDETARRLRLFADELEAEATALARISQTTERPTAGETTGYSAYTGMA